MMNITSKFLASLAFILILASNAYALDPWGSREWAQTLSRGNGGMSIETAMNKTLTLDNDLLTKAITTNITAVMVKDIWWSTSSMAVIQRRDGTLESRGYELCQSLSMPEAFNLSVVDSYDIDLPLDDMGLSQFKWSTSYNISGYNLTGTDLDIFDLRALPSFEIPDDFDIEPLVIPQDFANMSSDMDMSFTIGVIVPNTISKDGMTCSWTQAYTAEIGPMDMAAIGLGQNK